MESNDKLKGIDINSRTCYYFNDIFKIEDFDYDNILIDEKPYKNILVYNITYKTLIAAKSLRIRFDKTDGFIRVYDRTRYLVLFAIEKHDSIYNRIIYLISVKSGVIYAISHNYAKIKVDSYNSSPLEKTMTFHNVILFIKSVWNKDQNYYHCNISFKKASDEIPKK